MGSVNVTSNLGGLKDALLLQSSRPMVEGDLFMHQTKKPNQPLKEKKAKNISQNQRSQPHDGRKSKQKNEGSGQLPHQVQQHCRKRSRNRSSKKPQRHRDRKPTQRNEVSGESSNQVQQHCRKPPRNTSYIWQEASPTIRRQTSTKICIEEYRDRAVSSQHRLIALL